MQLGPDPGRGPVCKATVNRLPGSPEDRWHLPPGTARSSHEDDRSQNRAIITPPAAPALSAHRRLRRHVLEDLPQPVRHQAHNESMPRTTSGLQSRHRLSQRRPDLRRLSSLPAGVAQQHARNSNNPSYTARSRDPLRIAGAPQKEHMELLRGPENQPGQNLRRARKAKAPARRASMAEVDAPYGVVGLSRMWGRLGLPGTTAPPAPARHGHHVVGIGGPTKWISALWKTSACGSRSP